MGLPNKKQLHQHKRGTRKALDTLDAMEQAENSSDDDPGIENLVKSKKIKSTAEVNQESSESSQESAESSENKGEKNLADSSLESSENKPVELNMEIEKSSDMEPTKSSASEKPKIKIDLDGLEEMSSDAAKIDTMEEVNSPGSSDATSATAMSSEVTENGEDQDTTVSSEEMDRGRSLNYDDDEDFEDTQKDKFLTFRISEESYGFPIQYVTEIIVIHKITEVPDTPVFVKGVINLRGKVIPVIDMRQRFGLEIREYDDRTCIIVVDYQETAVGLIVDTVYEVVDIPEDQIDPPPRAHSGIKSGYIQGMGKVGKKVNILLNIEKVLFVEEILAKRNDLEIA